VEKESSEIKSNKTKAAELNKKMAKPECLDIEYLKEKRKKIEKQ